MDLSKLSEIGLTQGEAKVYTALLKLGETRRAQLAKKSGVSPSKIYEIINRLSEKGLVSSVTKNGVLCFSAANPQRLNDFLEQKQKVLSKEQEMVSAMLPSLLATYQTSHLDTTIEVFTGWDGLLSAFLTLENSMNSHDESLVFGASIGKNPVQADLFFKKHQMRVEKRGYKVRIIFNEDMRKRKERHAYYDHHSRHHIRYLHTSTLTELYIYKEYVLFLMLLTQPIAIQIKNAEAVESFRQFFETMWKQAKR